MTDDWEEPSSSTTGGFGGGFGRGGGGFGRGSSSGFGSRGGSMTTETGHWGEVPVDDAPVENRLRGFGRGRTLRANDNTSGSGSGFGSGGGFGRGKLNNDSSSGDGIKKSGFGGGGFGKSNDDENNNKGGFKKGGFGSSNGSGGFGSTNDDEPRGGGFGGGFKSGGGGGFGGGRSGGGGDGERKSGACYKCQEEGHMARDCPSAGGGGGRSNACFKCQEEGHMARDCPSAGGGGGRSNACFKCNEEGHMARDCPSAGGGGGGRSGGRGCHKCGEEGHFARECPSSEGGGGGGGGGGKGCYKCGEQGHFARECPNEDGGAKSGGFGGKSSGGFGGKSSGGFGSSGGGGDDEGGDKKSGCFKCGEDGHFARECPNPEKAGADGEKREIYIPPPPPEDEAEIFKSMQMGINFNKYDDIPVHCTGNDAPKKGVDRFDQVDLYETFQGNVTKAKYDKPTPVQKWAIPIIMSGRDLMACAQTGSGKTAAFLLPVLTGMMKNGLEGSSFSEVQEPQALIIGPTRELVVQIHQEARKFAHGTMLRPVVVYGGTSVGHQLRQVEQGTHLLVGTPGRLVDFIQRGKISLAKLKYLILDEADRMLDMGFVPEIRKIVDTMQMPPKTERQTLMFSATFPEAIQQLAGEFLENYLFVTVGKVGGANTDIEQTIHNVSHYDKRDKLVSLLNDAGSDRVLVFVEQKRNADFLASFLSQSDFPTTSIHGDRLQREREEALRDFKLGKAPVLVATSVAARGLDIPDVKHVINYDMPSDIDEYVHRIGRTGRCGNLGKASSFFNPESDGQLARPLVKVLQEAQQEVPDWLEEAAQNSFGSGGFTGMGGKFGSKDTRRGQFGGDEGGTSNGFGGGGGGGGGAAEEEVWD